MILTENERKCLMGFARHCLLRLRVALNDKDEYQLGIIRESLEEACSMGRAIAHGEVTSTPWEWLSQPIMNDGAKNDAFMNQMAEQGWELHMASGHWLFWRRRKAVRELEEVK